MFRSPTVLILGAGASAEVGLPVGSQLLDDIATRLDIRWPGFDEQQGGDKELLIAIHEICHHDSNEVGRYLEAGHQIIKSSRQAISIDHVIDSLEDDRVEHIGKLSIASSILNYEKQSSFFQRKYGELDLLRFKDTWYNQLTKILTEGIKKSQVGSIFDNLTIINFNYDRCIEQYIPDSLASYYGGKVEQFTEIFGSAQIYRPYGSVGKLPWEKRLARSIRFGEASPDEIVDAAYEIRTFTEQMDDETVISGMRQAIDEARHVAFLGFAFHHQNLDLISPATIGSHHDEGKTILSTVRGISASDQEVIADELTAAFDLPRLNPRHYIRLSELTCNDFFKEYWRTLTA